ncbi:MAG: carbohydrate binding domain-containing protein [Sedimentisphaerales bacterium]|nr:carbohydrate binding domain-containing protein [Sedimentisphaerales bacterium]
MKKRIVSFFTLYLTTIAFADDFIPFVIPAEPSPNSAIHFTSDPILTEKDRIVVRNGHFYRGQEPIRFWGVNFSFSANFPEKNDAPIVARRLAGAGINSIRCHHMDTSHWPQGLWDPQKPDEIYPEALDRLDFFINELAKVGIYIDLNLHVGHPHSRFLDIPESNRQYDKISNLFTPALIDAQKEFAHKMLTHFNPYRKMRYADDPAIAIIEITNENSFFMWSSEETIRTMPLYYNKLLQQQFNDWLKKKYTSQQALAAAWNKEAEPLGTTLLKNGTFSQVTNSGVPANWNTEQHGECKASTAKAGYLDRQCVKIDIKKTDSTEWHIQFNQNGLSLKEGQYYTVSFWAAAPASKKINCNITIAHEPWSNMGLARSITLSPTWQEFRLGFTANASDDNARLSFVLGADETDVFLAHVQLRPGGQVGLDKNESLAQSNIALFGDNEVEARKLDRLIFLAETEKTFFDGMRSHIKNTLGSKSLVTGTIVFGPLGLYGQSDMDFIDAHAYWQHPRFPNRPWDQNDWLIEQKSMINNPEEAILFRLACERLAGKPFTVTEYNHPAPLDSQAECVPLIASFAAAQDWDGVWLYSYSHSNNAWGKNQFTSFFDIHANPGKWGFIPAGAAIFLKYGFHPLGREKWIPLTEEAPLLTGLAKVHAQYDRNMFEAMGRKSPYRWYNLTIERVGYVLDSSAVPQPFNPAFKSYIDWQINNQKGGYSALGPGVMFCAGDREMVARVSRQRIMMQSPDFVVVALTILNGNKWVEADKILLSVCGRCENVGMGFSQDRRTIGTRWGTPPARIEAPAGTVEVPPAQWTCHALKPDGTLGTVVPVNNSNNKSIVSISPKYQTMWYLLTK